MTSYKSTAQRLHGSGNHPEILVITLATLGGIARYFHDNRRNNTPFNIFRFIIKTSTCMFTGFATYYTMLGLGFNNDLAVGATCLSAWLGVEALSYCWIIIQRYFDTKFPPL